MYQVIITIIAAISSFCAFYLFGSRKQQERDAEELSEYKSRAENQILQALKEKAKAEAEVKKEQTESALLKKTVEIVEKEPIQSVNDQIREEIEKAESEEDMKAAMDLLMADSKRRAEEVAKRYD